MQAMKPAEQSQNLSRNMKVTANSALSEYLAVNMMNVNPMISLADFPESSDQSYLPGRMGRSGVSESHGTWSYRRIYSRRR